MWKKDADEFFKLEEERKQREKELNLMHVEILKSQMQEKDAKKRRNMNNHEARINKDLLKKIHKGGSEGGSQVE
jgi:hypothetical protein